MLPATTKTAVAALLACTTLVLGGCAEEPTTSSEAQDATEVQTWGTATLASVDDDQVAIRLRTTGRSFDFVAGQQSCFLSNDPQVEDRARLLCDSVYLVDHGDDAIEARLAGAFIDSEPICNVWQNIVGPDVPEAICFPAGSYDDENPAPSVWLRMEDGSGAHPFAVADLVDEAVSGLVGLTSFDGRVVSSVRWTVWSDDFAALQLLFRYEDGTTSKDCASTLAPSILTEGGEVAPEGAVAAYAERLQTESDTFCD